MNQENVPNEGPGIPPPLPSRSTSMPADRTAAGGPLKPLPAKLSGWCWGGFLLSWVWAVRFRVWWGLLALVPLLGLGVMIMLGLKGRELAWRNLRWESADAFNRSQRRWTIAGTVTVASALAFVAAGYAQQNMTVANSDETAASSPPPSWPATGETPQVQVAPDQTSKSLHEESGELVSYGPDLPTRIDTISGPLERRESPDGTNLIYLNGLPLFSGEVAHYQSLIKKFHLPDGSDAVLAATSGARGNSCETMFFFLVFDASGLHHTPEFGTCSPNATYRQQNNLVTLIIPQMGGMSTFELKNGIILNDGQAVPMTDEANPSR